MRGVDAPCWQFSGHDFQPRPRRFWHGQLQEIGCQVHFVGKCPVVMRYQMATTNAAGNANNFRVEDIPFTVFTNPLALSHASTISRIFLASLATAATVSLMAFICSSTEFLQSSSSPLVALRRRS